jgi:tetratricopeptide (TPR) repeat protein
MSFSRFGRFPASGAGFVLLTMVFCPFAGGADTIEREVRRGEVFRPEDAGRLAWAAAWLDGLQEAGDRLAADNAVRLARLDRLQRQGLAALMGLAEVSVTAPFPATAGGLGDSGAVAVTLRVPEGREISRRLGETEARRRQEELVMALRRLLPEILELADARRLAREDADAAASARNGSFAADADVSEADMLAARLDALEAYALYRRALEEFSGAWENPSAAFALLERAAALAPAELPLRLTLGELMLLLERPQGALRLLASLPAPGARDGQDGAEREEMLLHVRGLHLRALAQLKSGLPALAENDLNEALAFAPERADLWLARGAARQVREHFDAMCGDYRQACVLGACEGLAAARRNGRCPAEN